MPGKFVLKGWATSEAYESKRAALNGIESVRKHGPDAMLDDQTEK